MRIPTAVIVLALFVGLGHSQLLLQRCTVPITVQTSGCGTPLTGATIFCPPTVPLPATVIGPGVYAVAIPCTFPKTLTISRSGYITGSLTLTGGTGGTVTLTCTGSNCTNPTTMVTVQSACNAPASSTLTTSTTGATVTSSTPNVFSVASCTFPATVTASAPGHVSQTVTVSPPSAIITLPCLTPGGWTAWISSMCSATCGGGTFTRFRSCTNPPPSSGGDPCVGQTVINQTCNTQPCPVNGVWGAWNTWGSCSATCGTGFIRRTRLCNNPVPANGGLPCPGDSAQDEMCTLPLCPVNGIWGPWGEYSACSTTCTIATSTVTRTRTCNNPAAANGGTTCPGAATETASCPTKPCPYVPGGWTPWTTWGDCSALMGAGMQTRTRTCTNPTPSDPMNNACTGNPTEMRACTVTIPP